MTAKSLGMLSWFSIRARFVQFVEQHAPPLRIGEGKMLVEFEAPDRDALEKWFRDEGFHYDWVLRVEFEARGGKLEPA